MWLQHHSHNSHVKCSTLRTIVHVLMYSCSYQVLMPSICHHCKLTLPMGFILFYDYYTNLEHALKHVTVEQQNYRNAEEKINETILLQNQGLSLQ